MFWRNCCAHLISLGLILAIPCKRWYICNMCQYLVISVPEIRVYCVLYLCVYLLFGDGLLFLCYLLPLWPLANHKFLPNRYLLISTLPKSNILNSHSGGARFVFRPGQWLSRDFHGLPPSLQAYAGNVSQTGNDCFLPNPFQFIVSHPMIRQYRV